MEWTSAKGRSSKQSKKNTGDETNFLKFDNIKIKDFCLVKNILGKDDKVEYNRDT